MEDYKHLDRKSGGKFTNLTQKMTLVGGMERSSVLSDTVDYEIIRPQNQLSLTLISIFILILLCSPTNICLIHQYR